MARKYLHVTYEDKDLAKRLGARWDPNVRRWYCPQNSQLSRIFAWRPLAVERSLAKPVLSLQSAAGQNANSELPLAF